MISTERSQDSITMLLMKKGSNDDKNMKNLWKNIAVIQKMVFLPNTFCDS